MARQSSAPIELRLRADVKRLVEAAAELSDQDGRRLRDLHPGRTRKDA